MKQFLSFLLFTLCGLLFSQEYTTLLQANNLWKVRYDDAEGYGNSLILKIKLSDQTIIYNGKEYTQLKIKTKEESSSGGGNFEWSDWELSSIYLYEDLDSKKVYIYYENNEWVDTPGEYLLYDFNLEIGDSIPIDGFHPISMQGIEHIVTNITYENILGFENVKTFHTAYSDFKIYEGIGSSFGLFTYWDFEAVWLLEVFNNNPEDYTPFVQTEKGWEFTFNEMDLEFVDYQMKIIDETIEFNENTFHSVQLRNRTRFDQNPTSDWSNWTTKFYLRDDIENKKVYVYYPDTNTFNHAAGEFLLYNFDLEQNNDFSLQGFNFTEGHETSKIISVTNESIYGTDDLQTYNFNVDDTFQFKIYEGIGSTTGPITMSFILDAGWTLTNYGILSVKDFVLPKTKVYPNPFTSQIQIDSQKPIKQLQLFDLTGKIMETKSSVAELNSHLGKLNSSVYILTITYQNNSKESFKLMKR